MICMQNGNWLLKVGQRNAVSKLRVSATSSPTKHTRNIGSVRFEHLDNVYGEIDF